MSISRKRRSKGRGELLGEPLKIDNIRGTIERGGRKRGRQVTRFFHPIKPLGWQKDLPQKRRLAIAVKSRSGDTLAAGRALQAMANVTRDTQTRQRASEDAKILFIRHTRGRKG